MNPKLKPLPIKQSMGSQLANINKPFTTVTSTSLYNNKNPLMKTIAMDKQKHVESSRKQYGNEIKPNLSMTMGTNTKKMSVGGNNNIVNNATQKVPPRQIKTPMRMQRTSTKKIQLYESFQDDFNLQLQDKYLQSQLQKNIKQQQTLPSNTSMKKQPQNKALIVLPKLDSDVKVKNVKDLEKQMDLEMSRMMLEDKDDAAYN